MCTSHAANLELCYVQFPVVLHLFFFCVCVFHCFPLFSFVEYSTFAFTFMPFLYLMVCSRKLFYQDSSVVFSSKSPTDLDHTRMHTRKSRDWFSFSAVCSYQWDTVRRKIPWITSRIYRYLNSCKCNEKKPSGGFIAKRRALTTARFALSDHHCACSISPISPLTRTFSILLFTTSSSCSISKYICLPFAPSSSRRQLRNDTPTPPCNRLPTPVSPAQCRQQQQATHA